VKTTIFQCDLILVEVCRKECLGVTFSKDVSFAHLDTMLDYVYNIGCDSLDTDTDISYDVVTSLREAMSTMKTDSMGLGTIVYFPSVQYVDSDEQTTD
jgi:hypothetical protein